MKESICDRCANPYCVIGHPDVTRCSGFVEPQPCGDDDDDKIREEIFDFD